MPELRVSVSDRWRHCVPFCRSQYSGTGWSLLAYRMITTCINVFWRTSCPEAAFCLECFHADVLCSGRCLGSWKSCKTENQNFQSKSLEGSFVCSRKSWDCWRNVSSSVWKPCRRLKHLSLWSFPLGSSKGGEGQRRTQKVIVDENRAGTHCMRTSRRSSSQALIVRRGSTKVAVASPEIAQMCCRHKGREDQGVKKDCSKTFWKTILTNTESTGKLPCIILWGSCKSNCWFICLLSLCVVHSKVILWHSSWVQMWELQKGHVIKGGVCKRKPRTKARKRRQTQFQGLWNASHDADKHMQARARADNHEQTQNQWVTPFSAKVCYS